MYKLAAVIAVCFFMFILWIIYLANTGGSSIFFDFVRTIPYGDKFGHAGLFGLLTLVSIIGLRYRSFGGSKFRIYYGVCFVALFVIAEESSQMFIPTRTFDFVDLAADMIGIFMASAICFVASQQLTKRPR